jgi:hypothetical protein
MTQTYIYVFTEVARDDDEIFPDFVLDRAQHIGSVQLLVQRDNFDRDGGAALLREGVWAGAGSMGYGGARARAQVANSATLLPAPAPSTLYTPAACCARRLSARGRSRA